MLDTGVVHENVDPPGRLQSGFDHLGDRLRLRHVGARVGHPNVEIRGDPGLRIRDLLRLAEAVEDDLRAGGSQGTGDASPMPLVEPVTSDTFPNSAWPTTACPALLLSGRIAMFMTCELLGWG